MFTGIVEEIGRVASASPRANGLELSIEAPKIAPGLQAGSSVAVAGACQTVLAASRAGFTVSAESETLRATTLGELRAGMPVNLERALQSGGRFDGHLVLGHVDARGQVVALRAEGRSRVVEIELPEELWPYVVPKGSIAVDGVSLTVGPQVRAGRFELFLIPYTWGATTLQRLRPGSAVNVETDIVGRYVAHLLGQAGDPGARGLGWDALQRAFGKGDRD